MWLVRPLSVDIVATGMFRPMIKLSVLNIRRWSFTLDDLQDTLLRYHSSSLLLFKIPLFVPLVSSGNTPALLVIIEFWDESSVQTICRDHKRTSLIFNHRSIRKY